MVLFKINLSENWQLAVLPQSEASEFDPRLVNDDFTVPFRVTFVPLGQSIKRKPKTVWKLV